MAARTLLTVANACLLNIGERPLTTTSSTMGQRVITSLQEAFNEIQSMQDWPWLRARITATNWSGPVATIPNIQRLLGAYWIASTGGGSFRIKVVSYEEYILYDSLQLGSGGVPEFITLLSENTVGVYPYPGVDTQSNLVLDVARWLDLPATDTTLFTIPDQYVDLIVKRASGLLAIRQLGDAALGGLFFQEYNNSLRILMSRVRNTAHQGNTMYRGQRGRYLA